MNAMKFAIAIFIVSLSSMALAQHEMHNMTDEPVGIIVSTLPANNAVLARSPEVIVLQFDNAHTLVKLAVKDPDSDIIDINFRFDPRPDTQFTQALPELEGADYYAVEWAVLDRAGKLIRGSFHFSFGDNAMPPSHYLDQMEHRMRIMSPDYKLL